MFSDRRNTGRSRCGRHPAGTGAADQKKLKTCFAVPAGDHDPLPALDFVEKTNLGMVLIAPLDVVLDKSMVLQPDVYFVAKERYHIITAACLKGVPDLVVEVISPSSGVRDRIKKSRIYRRYGVKEYWLVDPGAKTVEVLAEGERGWFVAGAYDEEEILTSPLLPGLQVKLKELFALPEGLILEY